MGTGDMHVLQIWHSDMPFLQWFPAWFRVCSFGLVQGMFDWRQETLVEFDRFDQFCSLLRIFIVVSVRLSFQCFWLELELFEGRSCAHVLACVLLISEVPSCQYIGHKKYQQHPFLLVQPRALPLAAWGNEHHVCWYTGHFNMFSWLHCWRPCAQLFCVPFFGSFPLKHPAPRLPRRWSSAASNSPGRMISRRSEMLFLRGGRACVFWCLAHGAEESQGFPNCCHTQRLCPSDLCSLHAGLPRSGLTKG